MDVHGVTSTLNLRPHMKRSQILNLLSVSLILMTLITTSCSNSSLLNGKSFKQPNPYQKKMFVGEFRPSKPRPGEKSMYSSAFAEALDKRYYKAAWDLASPRNVNVPMGNTPPLLRAVQAGAYKLGHYMLDLGADPNARDNYRNVSAAYLVARAGNVEMAKTFADRGAGNYSEIDVAYNKHKEANAAYAKHSQRRREEALKRQRELAARPAPPAPVPRVCPTCKGDGLGRTFNSIPVSGWKCRTCGGDGRL